MMLAVTILQLSHNFYLMEHNVLQVYLVADLEAQNFKLRRNEIRSTKLG
jgi:hypothetical protein